METRNRHPKTDRSEIPFLLSFRVFGVVSNPEIGLEELLSRRARDLPSGHNSAKLAALHNHER
jgi:hypothetical protein